MSLESHIEDLEILLYYSLLFDIYVCTKFYKLNVLISFFVLSPQISQLQLFLRFVKLSF